jgi:hypothetical protein
MLDDASSLCLSPYLGTSVPAKGGRGNILSQHKNMNHNLQRKKEPKIHVGTAIKTRPTIREKTERTYKSLYP